MEKWNREKNGDIKNENQKEATRLRGNFPPFNQK